MVVYLPRDDHYQSFLLPSEPPDWMSSGLPTHAKITAVNFNCVHTERVQRLEEVVAFVASVSDDQAWRILEHKGLILRVLRDLQEINKYTK